MGISRFVRAAMACVVLSYSAFAVAEENPADSLLPDFYNDPTLSTSGIRLEDFESSSVDYFSGMMSRSATDLSLPGNGGMTLAFRRSYNSQQPYVWPEHTALGVGWNMNFGWVEVADVNKMCDAIWSVSVMDNPVLHMPDGSTDVMAMTDAPFADPTMVHYRGRNGMGIICGGTLDPLNPFIMVGPDGTRYEFERWSGGGAMAGFYRTAKWFVKRIVDRHGNWMWIDYADVGDYATVGTVVAPLRVTTSDGRDVTLEYENSLLKSIVYGGQPVVEYTYAPSDIAFGGFSDLVQVELREELVWSYEYSGKEEPGAGSMTRATNPFGGRTDYTWQQRYFQNGDGQQLNAAVARVEQNGSATPTAVWTYSYTPATESGQRDVTTVTAPEGVYQYTHFSAVGMSPGSVWKVGLKERVVFTPVSGPVRTEEYTWSPYYISAENYKRTSSAGMYLAVDQSYYGSLLTSQVTRIGSREWRTTSSDWLWGASYIGTPQAQTVTMTGPDGTQRVLNRRYEQRPAVYVYFLLHQEFITQALFPNNTPMTVDFNALGDPVKRFDKGFYTFLEYDELGNLASSTRGLNGDQTQGTARITRFSDYYLGVARHIEHPDTTVTALEVDPFGRTVRKTDRDGKVRSYAYDGLGRVLQIDYPLGNDTLLSYDGRVTQLNRGNYRRTTTADGFGRNVDEVHSDTEAGRAIRVMREYDELGRTIFTSFPNSISGTHYQYDDYSRVVRATHPGGYRSYNYVDGYYVDVTDENGSHTRLFREEVEGPGKGELVRIESPEGVVTKIQRNEYGLPLRIEQGDGTNMLARINNYSPSLVLLDSTEPESGHVFFYYDHAGNVKDLFHETTPGFGRYQHNDYDLNDRVITTTAPTSETIFALMGEKEYYDVQLQFTYTPEGKPVDQVRTETIARWAGGQQVSSLLRSSTWHQEYDDNGNLLSERLAANGNTWQFDYTYDANDRLATLGYPGNEVVSYAPDAYGWPTRVGNYAADVRYHETGQLAGFAYGNGRQMNIAVNDRYLIDAMAVPGISSLSYDYDPAGNVVAIADGMDATQNVALRYDDMNRLVGADGAWGVGAFAYDKVGNITQKTIGGDTLSLGYDARNRLGSVSGSRSRQYSYDWFGNIAMRNAQIFGYDGLGNLMAVPQSSMASGTKYQYDARGRRLAAFRNGSAQYTLYANGDRLLYETDPAEGTWQRNIHVGAMLIARNEHYIACYEDIDGDGIPHCAETEAGLDPRDPLDATGDRDNDGLTNLQEYQGGTGISDADTDDDGMGDGVEVSYGLDPKVNDAGGDLDGDGLPNSVELARGFDPANAADGMADADGDGLSNAQEYSLGTVWNDADSDNDGMGDGYEVGKGLNPLANDANGDLDGDGMSNRYEFDQGYDPADPADGARDDDGDGLTNRQESLAGTNPRNADSDNDGMGDGYEVGKGLNPLINDTNGDLDGDGMPNKYEFDNGFDPAFAGDGAQDVDGDGLTNAQERQRGTNPRNADTDGDGLSDGQEVGYGLNPLVSDLGVDSDQDMLPNIWEVTHGLKPYFFQDGFMDHDSDGVPTNAEYNMGTDPFVAEIPSAPGVPNVTTGDGKTWVTWQPADLATSYRLEWGVLGETTKNAAGGQYSGRAYSTSTINDTLYWFQVFSLRRSAEAVGPRVVALTGRGNDGALSFTQPAGCQRTQLELAGDGAFFFACERNAEVTIYRLGPGVQPAQQIFPAGALQGGKSGWRLGAVLDGDAFYVWLDAATNTLMGSRYTAVDGRWDDAAVLANGPAAVYAFDPYTDWAGMMGVLYAVDAGYTSQGEPQYSLMDKPLGSTWFGQPPQITRTGRPWHIDLGSRDHTLIGESMGGVDHLVSAMLTTNGYPVYDWGAILGGSRPSVDREITGWADGSGNIHAAYVCPGLICTQVQAQLEASSSAVSFAFAGAGSGQVYWYAPGAIRYTKLVQDTHGHYSWSRAATLLSDAKLNDPTRIRLAHGETSAGIYWSNSASEIRTSQSNLDGTWRTPVVLPVTGKVVDATADVAGNQVLMVEQNGNYLFRERRRLPSGVDYSGDTTAPVVTQSSVRSGKTTIKHVVTLNADEPANMFFSVVGGTIEAGGSNTTAEQRYTGPVTITFPKGSSATIIRRGINMAERWSSPASTVLQ